MTRLSRAHRFRKWLLATWLVVLVLLPSLAYAREKTYDFEFKGMDLKKVISSIAKLENKSVLFSRTVESREIDLSLSGVTAPLALRLVLKNYGYYAVSEGGILHVMSLSERQPAAYANIVIPLRYVLAKDIEANVRGFIGNQGTISVNEQRNALVVSVPDELLSKVRSMIDELDQESSQIFIEAKIVETTTNFSRDLGVRWGPNLNDRNVPGVNLQADGNDDTLRVNIGGLTSSLNARILAGERSGELKVLSSPKISTMNGVAATIDSLQTFSIRTLSALGVGGGGGGAVAGGGGVGGGGASLTPGTPGTATNGIQQVRAGISLQVTPYIISDQQVRLNMSLSKSDPDFSQPIDGIPGIATNAANTSLIVKSGQTASIGGLIRHSSSKNRGGAPFLNGVPILGHLFGSSGTKDDDREILIFLTPTIYRIGGDPSDRPEEAEVPPSVIRTPAPPAPTASLPVAPPIANLPAAPLAPGAAPAVLPPLPPANSNVPALPLLPQQGALPAASDLLPRTASPLPAPAPALLNAPALPALDLPPMPSAVLPPGDGAPVVSDRDALQALPPPAQ